MNIQTFTSDKLIFTAYAYFDENKDKIMLKVKKPNSNLNYFKILDKDYFSDNNVYEFIENNLDKINEECVEVDFDKKELTIKIVHSKSMNAVFTFEIKTMSNVDIKNENNNLVKIMIENNERYNGMNKDLNNKIKYIRNKYLNAISSCEILMNKLNKNKQEIDNFIGYDSEDETSTSSESDDASHPVVAKKKLTATAPKKSLPPPKKASKKAVIEESSDDSDE